MILTKRLTRLLGKITTTTAMAMTKIPAPRPHMK